MKRITLVLLVPIALLLEACSSSRPAPVTDSRPTPPKATSPASKPAEARPEDAAAKPAEGRTHLIGKGESLIAIALQYGLDYRELAAWNNIENPNVIKVGETLRLTAPDTGTPATAPKPGEPVATPLVITPQPAPPGTSLSNTDRSKVDPKTAKLPYSEAAYAKLSAEAAAAAGVAAPAATAPTALTPPATPAAAGAMDWAWPVKGKLLTAFTEGNKGIDIAGVRNTPVLAAAGGKVIYNQSAMRGYGRLVIIKHNDTWLSAYAHNEKVLVNEGQIVKKGEKIAEMGSSDTDVVKLHFEIRKQGNPVDPVKLLPAQ